MGIMTTVSPVSKIAGLPDFFDGIRADNTAMVFCFDELVEVIEHDVLCNLLCGDTLIVNLPAHVGMTKEDWQEMESEVASLIDEDNVHEHERKTQEYILGYKSH